MRHYPNYLDSEVERPRNLAQIQAYLNNKKEGNYLLCLNRQYNIFYLDLNKEEIENITGQNDTGTIFYADMPEDSLIIDFIINDLSVVNNQDYYYMLPLIFNQLTPIESFVFRKTYFNYDFITERDFPRVEGQRVTFLLKYTSGSLPS